MLVVDASVVVAGLVDGGENGSWAETVLTADVLAAPHIMPVEVANILRRLVLADEISSDLATLAHADLLDLGVKLFPYAALATRAWELRSNLTVYDACYVALAESLGADLATLDHRLSRASGPRCSFRLPGAP